MKLAVTGSKGLLGWHASARIHAGICAAKFAGRTPPYELVTIDHAMFGDAHALNDALQGTDVILHFAGMNRGEDELVERANPDIATDLVEACRRAGIRPHIIYANSTHSANDSPYGRSKRIAGEILGEFATTYTDLILPHIFGECARPYYNNVTATLIDKIWKGELPEINPDGRVQLLHAGEAAQIAIDAATSGTTGLLAPAGRDMSIPDLHSKILAFHQLYTAGIFPEFDDAFDLALFNSYRTAGYPDHYPLMLKTNRDRRGMLVETAKGGNRAQSFISSTVPGERRGDHFHLDLVERFLVVKGNATIRVRRVLTDELQEFHVTGDEPAAIDMPPMHTHHIENSSDADVVTFFWAHRLFDPENPDTYADKV